MPPNDARGDAGPDARVVITREGLCDGSLLARVRANLLPGMTVRSDAEIEASLDATLATHDPTRDAWLFAYGSLMWNPAIRTAGQRCALLRGWHRRFCFTILSGRGSPEHPGLMLGLDPVAPATGSPGGSTRPRPGMSCCWCGGVRCSGSPTCRAG